MIVLLHINIKPIKGTLILLSRFSGSFRFPFPTVAMETHSQGLMACDKQDLRGKQVGITD